MPLNAIDPAMIAQAFADVLEQLAFIAPLPPDGPAPVPENPLRLGIGLSGIGTLELVAGEAFGLLLASSLLGTQPSDPEAAARSTDALKELMNVAGGAVVSTIADLDREPVEMGIPTVGPFNAAEWEAFTTAPDAGVLDADGHTIAFRLRGGP
jgi:hypothetical protein